MANAMSVNKLLGTQELPSQAQYYMRMFLYLSMLISFLTSMSSTFYVLFTIDAVGFALAGICASIMLATQTLFDYPSGSLGDYIGQKWVLALAFFFFGISFFLLISAKTFSDFAFISIIMGLGNAQYSGTFNTWIDNNYRIAVGDADPDRKIYGFSTSRANSFNNLALGFSFILGGIIATNYSRQNVFAIQTGLSVIVILLVITYLKDIKVSNEEKDKATSSNSEKIINYLLFLKGGVTFLFSSKATFLFLFGLSVYNVTWLIWGNLILTPLYFGYTGTDALAGLLRTSLFFTGIPLAFFMANVSRKFSNNSLPKILFLQVALFFPSFFLLTSFVPPVNEFNETGIIVTFILLFVLVGTIFDLSITLTNRIMVDFVPSENRNSVYSLLPTIYSLIGIFVLPFAGILIENDGMASGLAFAGVFCLIGSVLIFLGMRFKHVNMDLMVSEMNSVTQLNLET